MKTVKRFIKQTPIWYKSLSKDTTKQPCICCGIIPDNLLQTSKAVANQSENILSYINEKQLQGLKANIILKNLVDKLNLNNPQYKT